MMCGLTYSAHPIGCAAAVATLNEYKNLNIADNVAKQGKVLGQLLEALKEKHACVAQVRYIGLLTAIELVKHNQTREPIVAFNEDPQGLMNKIIGMLKKEGFYTYSHENMIIVAPPLIITEEELREAMGKHNRVMHSVDNMNKYI